MMSQISKIGLVIAATFIVSLLSTSSSLAENQPSTTEVIPIDEQIGLEKTNLTFYASPDNTLPWGFVEGTIVNHVPSYPVIIQIYDDNGEAYHFAQTNVEEDGSFEYRFRVSSVDDGKVINIFEGDYFVTIYKVVYLHSDSIQA
ncbi:MAG: conserved exported protein of unknown function [Nitrosopumilales archaeon]|nr:MAG: conserved exported protein of unknown function [Nitrosopumilales archaeon]